MTMEKNILQRLMEYLRDIPSSGNVAPPSAERCPECGRPRLTAIDGGKGKKDLDDNEQKKPTAVIGIPYSSDAAEETVEDEEEGEDAMKQMKKYMFGVGAAVAAVFFLNA